MISWEQRSKAGVMETCWKTNLGLRAGSFGAPGVREDARQTTELPLPGDDIDSEEEVGINIW